MTYLVLARKYRPRTFRDVVGQEVAIGVLQGALNDKRVGHAYLFCGPRGTGKTTSARIFAKALNCERGPASEPCCECERCRAAEEGAEVDLVEIDAASHTGVDNIRDLRDQAAYAPMRARFKIYLVDEVHMLSKAAFNALLKTLEEPPPHVKFLFATTELHKVPDTILSRCQVLRLAPISEGQISARMVEISRLEGLAPQPGVLDELSRRAHGGLRDALSLFDQLIALVGESPSLDDVARLGGERGTQEIDALLSCVEAHDRAGVVTAVASFSGDEDEVLSSVLDHLRTCLVVSLCGADSPILGVSPDARVRSRAERLSPGALEIWIGELLYARERMRLVPGHERVILEVALLELCRAEASIALAELAERLLGLEARLGAGASAPAVTSQVGELVSGPRMDEGLELDRHEDPPSLEKGQLLPHSQGEPGRTRAKTVVAPASVPHSIEPSASRASPREIWDRVLAGLEGSQDSLAKLLRLRARLDVLEGDRAVLKLESLTSREAKMLEGKRNLGAIARAFRNATGRETEVSFVQAAPPPLEAKDEFTQEVADLFGGLIEGDR